MKTQWKGCEVFYLFHIYKKKIKRLSFAKNCEKPWNTWNTWNISVIIVLQAIVEEMFHVYNKNAIEGEETWNKIVSCEFRRCFF